MNYAYFENSKINGVYDKIDKSHKFHFDSKIL